MKMIQEDFLLKDPNWRISRVYFIYRNIVLHFLNGIFQGNLQFEFWWLYWWVLIRIRKMNMFDDISAIYQSNEWGFLMQVIWIDILESQILKHYINKIYKDYIWYVNCKKKYLIFQDFLTGISGWRIKCFGIINLIQIIK